MKKGALPCLHNSEISLYYILSRLQRYCVLFQYDDEELIISQVAETLAVTNSQLLSSFHSPLFDTSTQETILHRLFLASPAMSRC